MGIGTPKSHNNAQPTFPSFSFLVTMIFMQLGESFPRAGAG